MQRARKGAYFLGEGGKEEGERKEEGKGGRNRKGRGIKRRTEEKREKDGKGKVLDFSTSISTSIYLFIGACRKQDRITVQHVTACSSLTLTTG